MPALAAGGTHYFAGITQSASPEAKYQTSRCRRETRRFCNNRSFKPSQSSVDSSHYVSRRDIGNRMREGQIPNEVLAKLAGLVYLPNYQPKPPMQAPEPSSKPRTQDMLTKL
jgi:hypothetical protein